MESQTINTLTNSSTELLLMVKVVASALVVSTGTFAAAFSQGKIAEKACESLSKANESAEKGIRSVFFYGIVFVETCALYCVILALIFLLLI